MPIPSNTPKPVRQTAKTIALEQIQKWIVEGILAPGEKINDDELAKALGVSRTPVREALQLLAVQGFVEMSPGKETRISQIEKNDVFKVYPPMAALQSTAAELAIENIQSSHLEEMAAINQQMKAAIDRNEIYEVLGLDKTFHDVMIDAADNEYIRNFTSVLHMHILRLEYLFFKSPQNSIEEHEQIIQACKEKDRKKAAELTYSNWIKPIQDIANKLM
ncbi:MULTISPECIES: GntR family transcriptional regulator [Bacillus]|jgi:DNA-binding GntR family transcriptional regulator|uniref:Transcriptional regulator, GntR family n=1 Tax=Bacillus spizizenii (strain DSM 15029 / JCM 12233 / NBRC 101239 / NRRL B-23049 / TU-B-10) TaxID=1052585 RepID=G4P0R5_BACS4|nr:GntR family transcriptional regulator [Bacillus spizizenii]APH66180.1 GntR family transcriptional regulator [Bacillus subtilis]MCY9376284.1 GntR family transcriptional regulator [Bacillus sp. T17B1]AEP88244.1 transcriptional regulator, GntR family [Bacillus spizizenii TU-B-10]MCI4168577.1 GntR family transcriptional regulator [Bacillus spizizenii]OUL04634.1 GntR family transcriptional regulator [Bacillus spizizenii]